MLDSGGCDVWLVDRHTHSSCSHASESIFSLPCVRVSDQSVHADAPCAPASHPENFSQGWIQVLFIPVVLRILALFFTLVDIRVVQYINL